jgi:hypothetical protein
VYHRQQQGAQSLRRGNRSVQATLFAGDASQQQHPQRIIAVNADLAGQNSMAGRLTNLWRRYRQSTGLAREAVHFALCLLVGALLIPAAIYLVGVKVLGPYEDGGYFSFVADIARSAAVGSWPFVLLVLGPYLGLWMLRLWRRTMLAR